MCLLSRSSPGAAHPGGRRRSAVHLRDFHGTLVFWARGVIGDELWKTDGTPQGTVPVHAFGGDSLATVQGLSTLGGTALIRVGQSDGTQLWRSDRVTPSSRP